MTKEVETGVLGREAVDFLFAQVPEHVRRITVSYRPLQVRRQRRHTVSRSDGLPLEVTPVMTEAQVTREGRIIPDRSVIARDILDLLARGAFSVGRVADLDRPYHGKGQRAPPEKSCFPSPPLTSV